MMSSAILPSEPVDEGKEIHDPASPPRGDGQVETGTPRPSSSQSAFWTSPCRRGKPACQ
jgi:hypothetical protein